VLLNSGDHPQQRNGPFGVPGKKPVAAHRAVCIAGSALAALLREAMGLP
jgi:hypothetical protein